MIGNVHVFKEDVDSQSNRKKVLFYETQPGSDGNPGILTSIYRLKFPL